jgi:hypothetical protein
VTSPVPPPLPAACADCLETTRFAQIGAELVQMATQQFRSLEGKLRFNFGTTSMIVNPLAGVRILLDHVLMEARILLNAPTLPGMPAIPMVAMGLEANLSLGAELAKMEQLGIAYIQGHEAQGMRYLFPPGGMLASWEVWISTSLKIPVLTRTIGTFGVRICNCKCVAVQPPAAMFEIPPGYKVIQPPAIQPKGF